MMKVVVDGWTRQQLRRGSHVSWRTCHRKKVQKSFRERTAKEVAEDTHVEAAAAGSLSKDNPRVDQSTSSTEKFGQANDVQEKSEAQKMFA